MPATIDGMIGRLDAYYHANGIHPEDFRCRFRASCSADCEAFTEARASLVGWDYDGLVFLSLDPGKGWAAIEERTFAAVQDRERQQRKWRLHWRETHRLAEALLRGPARGRFAHVNAAKCTQNKPLNAEADRQLFENCHGYLRGELEILEPRVIVTQGNRAHDALAPIANATPMDRFRSVTDKGVFWIRAYHAGARRVYWDQKRDHWQLWSDWVNGSGR